MMEFVWIMLAALIAFVSGRSLITWSVVTYFIGPLSLLVLVFLPKKQDKIQERSEFFRLKAESHVVKQEFKDVDTVDDLFKQLEAPRG